MSRTPFDQLSKQLIEELLTPFGQIQLNREVLGESRYIDLWFSPTPTPPADLSFLGLLGRFTTRPCLIEPFRHSPRWIELASCLLKLYSIRLELDRQAKREQQSLSQEQLPLLWILTPTASQSFLQGIGAKSQDDWPKGVYFSVESLYTRIVVIHHLPETDETLWLRLLARGKHQQRAIAEVMSLPLEDPRRQRALELLASWKMLIESSGEWNQEKGELMMALSPIFLEWKQAAQQEWFEQGTKQALLMALFDVIEIRFGQVPTDLREHLQHQDVDRLRALHREALICTDLDEFRDQACGS